MLGIAASLQKGGASLLTFVKDNLKLYLDFKSNKSDTLKFPCEGSTSFDGSNDKIDLGTSSSLQLASATYAVWIYWDGESNDTVFGRYGSVGTNIRWRIETSNKLKLYSGGWREN